MHASRARNAMLLSSTARRPFRGGTLVWVPQSGQAALG
jgi:hypothetical protein